jgi:hypothetical protein
VQSNPEEEKGRPIEKRDVIMNRQVEVRQPNGNWEDATLIGSDGAKEDKDGRLHGTLHVRYNRSSFTSLLGDYDVPTNMVRNPPRCVVVLDKTYDVDFFETMKLMYIPIFTCKPESLRKKFHIEEEFPEPKLLLEEKKKEPNDCKQMSHLK